MTGMNRTTGQRLSAEAHISQSIADILTTPLGSRIMRRDYGSLLPRLIDQPANASTYLQLYAATAMALMTWEPRIHLNRVQLSDITLGGTLTLTLDGTLADSGQPASLQIPLTLGAIR